MSAWSNYFGKLLNNNNEKYNFQRLRSRNLEYLENCMNSTDSELNKKIDEIEINKSIHDLKNGKASGIYLITNDMLKSGCVYLQKPITKLFN